MGIVLKLLRIHISVPGKIAITFSCYHLFNYQISEFFPSISQDKKWTLNFLQVLKMWSLGLASQIKSRDKTPESFQYSSHTNSWNCYKITIKQSPFSPFKDSPALLNKSEVLLIASILHMVKAENMYRNTIKMHKTMETELSQ